MKIIRDREYYTKNELFDELKRQRPDVRVDDVRYISRAIKFGYLRDAFVHRESGWQGIVIPKEVGDEYIRTRKAINNVGSFDLAKTIQRKKHNRFERVIHKGILEGKGLANNLVRRVEVNTAGLNEDTSERGIRYEYTRR